MSLDSNSLRVGASIAYALTKTNGNLPSARVSASSGSFSVNPSTTTYQQVLVSEFTLAAAANTDVDFRVFTTLLNESITTGNKILGFLITATGNTGQLCLKPGSSNDIAWFFGGTTPSLTLNCGTSGCCLQLIDGSAKTMDATHKTLNFSNPGSATITVDIVAIVGTP